jgi:Ser/Thr protein kinase RdoA (MazF antagonist)
MNDTYLVKTPRSVRVARVYRTCSRSVDEIQYELDLLLHLEARGVPVAPPIPSRSGLLVEGLEAPEGTRHLVLFEYAEGQPISWQNARHSYLAGRLAALIHAAADSFAPAQNRPPLDLDHLVDESLAVVLPFLAERPEQRRHVEQFAARLRARAAAAISPGLDWGVCHGDLGAANIHVASDGRATVFDFDLCGPGWRTWDLVAAYAVSLNESDRCIWVSFLRGYCETRSLGDADVAAVPVFHGINRLWSLGMRARNAPYRGSWPLEDRPLDSYLDSLRRWEAEHAAS